MTDELVVALAEHAAGNYRILMTMASELLDAAIQSGTRPLDEKLYLARDLRRPRRIRPRSSQIHRRSPARPSNCVTASPSNSVITLLRRTDGGAGQTLVLPPRSGGFVQTPGR